MQFFDNQTQHVIHLIIPCIELKVSYCNIRKSSYKSHIYFFQSLVVSYFTCANDVLRKRLTHIAPIHDTVRLQQGWVT